MSNSLHASLKNDNNTIDKRTLAHNYSQIALKRIVLLSYMYFQPEQFTIIVSKITFFHLLFIGRSKYEILYLISLMSLLAK